MKIGIGITTTPNRRLFDRSKWDKFLPADSRIYIHNDKQFRGVSHSKNMLLRALEDCEHIFLFDDDCYPIAEDWWKPYVESKEPHLMYEFKLPSKPPNDMEVLYQGESIVAYSHTRGAMLYIERRVLDVVGGMDYKYGYAMFEHTDWTNRIHNAGLTTYRAMDVPNSNRLLYCLDQDGKAQSSIPESLRKANTIRNLSRYHKSKTSKEYKDYK